MPVIKEISSYELGPSYHKKKLLYQFVKDCSECCRDSVDMIPSGTVHIGEFIEVSRVAREFETHTLLTYGLHFEVYYSKLPSESNFTNVSHKDMHVEPTDDEIRLYDIGDIGQEITKSTSPEQVAQKYFGNSNFSTFFEHETLPLVSKHMALSRADIPRWLNAKPEVSVPVPSRAYTTYNPSRFAKFKQAVYKSGVEALPLAAVGFIPTVRNALGYSNPATAYYAMAAAPVAYGIDLLNSHRSNEAMRKKLMFSPSDRDRLVNTGAMTTELAKRLVDGQTSHERYAILSRVHKKQQGKKGVYPPRGGKITHRKRNKRLKSNTRKYKHK